MGMRRVGWKVIIILLSHILTWYVDTYILYIDYSRKVSSRGAKIKMKLNSFKVCNIKRVYSVFWENLTCVYEC